MSIFHLLTSLFRRNSPAAHENQDSNDIHLAASAEWLIVGLGNPGARYAATRHNIGYMAVDALMDNPDVDFHGARRELTPHRATNSQLASATVGDVPVLLARANTFMNLSGESIGEICRHFSIPAQRVVVLHDELDIAPGTVRIKQGGGENGHNGLKSTTEHLGTRDYVRIRIGIGRPAKDSGISIPDFVLAPFTTDETWLGDTVALAARAAYAVVSEGISAAQNSIHSLARGDK